MQFQSHSSNKHVVSARRNATNMPNTCSVNHIRQTKKVFRRAETKQQIVHVCVTSNAMATSNCNAWNIFLTCIWERCVTHNAMAASNCNAWNILLTCIWETLNDVRTSFVILWSNCFKGSSRYLPMTCLRFRSFVYTHVFCMGPRTETWYAIV
jgi:hypothetical protein